jgi:hypothetical protein
MRSARSTPKIDLVTAWKLPTNSNPFFTFRRLIAICKKSFVLLHSSAMHHKTESQNRVEVNPYLTRYLERGRKMTELIWSSRLTAVHGRGSGSNDFGGPIPQSARKADHENFLSFSLKTRQSPTTSFIAQYHQTTS